jgi:hypothetical protein
MESGKLKQIFLQATSGNQEIVNQETWNFFISLLMKAQLLSYEERELLQKYQPSMPAGYENIIATMAQVVDSKPEIHQIVEHVLKLHSKLIQGRDTIEMWDLTSLSQNELCLLLLKLYSDLISVKKVKTILERSLEKLNTYSEDIQRIVYDKVYDKYKTIETAHVYQQENVSKLEKEWHKEKVRGVQYRNRPIKVYKEFINGVVKQLGYCARRDMPVEVVKIPRNFLDYQYMQDFINESNALKQLFFSEYFHKFLGFDDLSDENYNLYFFDILRGLNYRKINNNVSFIQKTILSSNVLMKYWSKELLNGFTDLLHKCTHSLKIPVGLQNVFIEDSGIKVYFKGLVYGDIRPEYSHEETEALYLVMFARLLLELITDDPDYNDFPGLSIDLSLKCILEECTKAYNRHKDRNDQAIYSEIQKKSKDNTVAKKIDSEINKFTEISKVSQKKTRLPGVEKPEKGFLNDQITFMRLQTHPYFTSDSDIDLAIVMEEYERVFGHNK